MKIEAEELGPSQLSGSKREFRFTEVPVLRGSTVFDVLNVSY